ncbi:MAG: OmpA family protein [Armatimonadetes bacterium]|nr:OmpA family protein [Armatimonadota bacterium]
MPIAQRWNRFGVCAGAYLRRALCCWVVLSLSAPSIFSQIPSIPSSTRIFAGPNVSAASGTETADIPVFGSSTACGSYTNGTSLNATVGGFAMLPELLSSAFGVGGGFSITRTSASFATPPLEPTLILDRRSDQVVRIDEEFRLKASYMTIGLEAMTLWHPFKRLQVGVGASVGLNVASSFQHTNQILGPKGYRFADGSSEQPLQGASSLQVAMLSIGPKLNLGYEFTVGNAVIMPHITFSSNAVSPLKDWAWQHYTIGGGISYYIDVTPRHVAPSPLGPGSVAVDELPKPPAAPPTLRANIDLFSVDDHDQRLPEVVISSKETTTRHFVPLLPAVFFERSATAFPDRYRTVTQAMAKRFKVNDLAGNNPVMVQHQVMNVIGLRMQQDTTVQITLVGQISREEAPEIARVRALEVRAYLIRAWGIDSSRITVAPNRKGLLQRSNESTEDGRADNRRVEILSDSPALLSPVITEKKEFTLVPPTLKINPTFDAEAGVKQWELSILHQGVEIGKFSSDEQGEESELMWDIIRENPEAAVPPLFAQLRVEDSTGRVVRAVTSVPLSVATRTLAGNVVAQAGDEEVVSFILAGYDVRSAEIARGNRMLMEEIGKTLRNGARVTVTGYADRLGDQQKNRELATERANRVAEAIRQMADEQGTREVAVHFVGGSIETDRFTNDLPEGRTLTRGVTVMIEQKIAQ